MFSKAELELVASLCQQHDVVCISDEVYQWLVYDGCQHISIGEPRVPPMPWTLVPGPRAQSGSQRRPGDSDRRVWNQAGFVTCDSDFTCLRAMAPASMK